MCRPKGIALYTPGPLGSRGLNFERDIVINVPVIKPGIIYCCII